MAGRKSVELRWRELLRRQADSGVSIRKFCRTERISEPSFYAWRKKLREATKDDLRSTAANRHQGNPPLFVPVKLLDNAPALEIIHPLGYRVQLTGEVNPVALRHVIQALDERGAS